MYDKSNKGKVVIKEAGPRFEMQLYEIRLGTLDQDTAEKEWVFCAPIRIRLEREEHYNIFVCLYC